MWLQQSERFHQGMHCKDLLIHKPRWILWTALKGGVAYTTFSRAFSCCISSILVSSGRPARPCHDLAESLTQEQQNRGWTLSSCLASGMGTCVRPAMLCGLMSQVSHYRLSNLAVWQKSSAMISAQRLISLLSCKVCNGSERVLLTSMESKALLAASAGEGETPVH